MSKLTLYTDGSCIVSKGLGGWSCVVVGSDGVELEWGYGGASGTTNNRMELAGILKGIVAAKRYGSFIEVVSDSQYALNYLKKSILNRNVKCNSDLLPFFQKVVDGIQIELRWVKGHEKNVMNNKCDKLAYDLAKSGPWKEDAGCVKKPIAFSESL